MNIRLENKQDFYTVELLTRDAFWGEFEPGCVEHYLAHILRDAPCFIPELDFVGEQDGRVIANVIFSHGSIDSPDGQRHDAISFGPFSVASDWKGRGVGGALLRHALDQARAMGFGIVCLHGHADYYPRFGFRPAREYGVSDDYGVGDALMAMALQPGVLDGVSGVWREDPIFEVDPAKAAAYEATLPYKAPAQRPAAELAFACLPAEAAQDDDGNAVEVAHDENGATAAIVFKTVSDQYGKFSLVKVVRGKITGDMSLYDTTTGNTEKLGRLYTLKGKKNEEVKEICCGDIGAIAKMDRVKTGDTLCDPKSIVKLAGMPYAEPCYSRAIAPKTRGQEEKLGTGLNRLNEEDPTFTVVNNAETHQMVVSGAGDIQIDVLVSKLKTRFGVDAELDTPRVPYREKIRKTVQKQGRHKKQTGGSGQFGDVWVRFEPNEESEEMVFAEEVFGGSVPKNFFPAVEKGLREAVLHGPLAGYPVVNLKCVLYDGSYHPVDSSEIAFKTAANLAYKAAMPEASPVLLEPVCELKVTVPDQYMGDILGDLNKRRGRVMGMTPTGDGEQIIEAECPEAELMSYAIDLRSMTQSRGSFTMHFVRYEQCSADAQEKAVAAAKAMQEAE